LIFATNPTVVAKFSVHIPRIVGTVMLERSSMVTQLVKQSVLLASVQRIGSSIALSLAVRKRQLVTLAVCGGEGGVSLFASMQGVDKDPRASYLRGLDDDGVGEFEVKPLGGGVVVDHVGRALASRVIDWHGKGDVSSSVYVIRY
jgi:hypothetical protein